MKKILITGAAGDVGSHLRRELAGRYALRLSDIRPIRDLAKGEEFIRGDCASLRDMLRVTKGVAAVVHLGGFSVEGSWEVILRANIIGTYNAFEAARRNGARRIVFATSNHAVGFYRRDEPSITALPRSRTTPTACRRPSAEPAARSSADRTARQGAARH